MDRELEGKAREVAEVDAIKRVSKGVAAEFESLVDEKSLDLLKETQNLIIGRLQDSNAVLGHFNDFSERCFPVIAQDLMNHTQLVKSVKSDLDYIFLKLRSMKAKLMESFPEAFNEEESTDQVIDRRPDLEMPGYN